MLIAQITDLHVPSPGTVREDGFDPAADTQICLDVLGRMDPAPDLVLATGDLVNDGSREEYARLKAMLAPLSLPVCLLAGNHDHRENLRAVLGPLPHDRPEQPFIQYTVDVGPVRVIALDTLDPGRIGGVLCDWRLAWFEATLAEAPERPTLVALHHPPFLTGVRGMDAPGFEGMQAFRALIEAHRQVRLVISGHMHRAIWTRIGHAPAATCPSPTFAFPAEFRPDAPFRRTTEAGGFMLHLWRDDFGEGGGFVSHTVLLNDPDRV